MVLPTRHNNITNSKSNTIGHMRRNGPHSHPHLQHRKVPAVTLSRKNTFLLIVYMILVLFLGAVIVIRMRAHPKVVVPVQWKGREDVYEKYTGEDIVDRYDASIIVPPEEPRASTDDEIPPSRQMGHDPRVEHPEYYRFFQRQLYHTLGREWTEALYDPEALNSRSTAYATGSIPAYMNDENNDDVDDLYFSSAYVKTTTPPMFRTPARVLKMSKVHLSIGIARMHRDHELAVMYNHLNAQRRVSEEAAVAFTAFSSAITRVLRGYAYTFRTLGQMAIDIMPAGQRDALGALDSKEPDVMIRIMKRIRHNTPVGHVQQLIDHPPAPTPTRDGTAHEYGSGVFSSVLFFTFTYGSYEEQLGCMKMWDMMHQTLACSSSVRLDEHPEAARYICNAEYLLYAPHKLERWLHLPTRPLLLTDDVVPPFPHRIEGFGSNNVYEWETNMVRLFTEQPHRSKRRTNTVGWISVFDCTVGTFHVIDGSSSSSNSRSAVEAPVYSKKREERRVLRQHVGFGAAKLCVGTTPTGTRSLISLRDLKGLELAELQPLSEIAQGISSISPDARISRPFPNKLAVDAFVEGRLWGDRGGTQLSSFDNVSVLKIDAEGSEHAVIPSWAREELAELDTAAMSPGSRAWIDFRNDKSTFFTTSILLLEIHRRYGDCSRTSALRVMWTILHTYSMGFLINSLEMNSETDCCAEMASTHYRYYIKSETWMALAMSNSN